MISKDMEVRTYTPDDYESVKSLYLDEGSYGGQFDEDRDSPDRLSAEKDKILVAVCHSPTNKDNKFR